MVKKRKKSKGVTMDFSETLDIWRPTKPVEVVLEITEVAEHDTDSKLVIDFKVVGGKFDGKPVRDFPQYEGKGAFRLRNLLEALGEDIPDEPSELDFDDLIGKEVGAQLTPDEYDGKPQTRIQYCTVEDLDTDDDEVPAKKSSKKKDDEEDEEKPAKKSSKAKKKAKDEEDEEDEEEEEKPSKKSSKKAGKKKAAITQEEIRDMDDEELQGVIDEHELEVDLSDFKTLKKQQAAVIDAAEEAGILSEE